MADCAYYLELMSQSLDGQLSPQGHSALMEHLNACGECKVIYQQLCDIHSECFAWEDEEVPAGFAEAVMERIQAFENESTPKIIPLWKRPQLRTLGSMAACALLCLGLWRTTAPQNTDSPAASVGQVPMTVQTDPQPHAKMTTVQEQNDISSPLMAADAAPEYKKTNLVSDIQTVTGVKPGLLLVCTELTEDADGQWFTLSDGSRCLLVQNEDRQALYQRLLPQAELAQELGDGPLVIILEPIA